MPIPGANTLFRQVPLGWRLIARDWVRFFITVAGAGMSLALMLFLVGAYEGVKTESNGYVQSRPVSGWVAQRGTNNLVRGTSFLGGAIRQKILEGSSIQSAAPFLRLVTTVQIRGTTYTGFVCGIEPGAAATKPQMVAGNGNLKMGEIIVDRAFAKRTNLAIGDTVSVHDHDFRVAGLTTGTNAVITQFMFVGLGDAQKLLPMGFQGIVSYFLVTGKPGVPADDVVRDLRTRLPDLNAFTSTEFAHNNLEELRNGLLPILATIAIFGGVVGATVLTLLLYSLILERREDYALLKALGVNRGYLRRLVLQQCLVAVTWGLIFGLVTVLAARPLLDRFVPVLVLSISWQAGAQIAIAALAMGALGAWLPLMRLEQIYPAEVFRA
jgi:putative ABC transport system permease protein